MKLPPSSLRVAMALAWICVRPVNADIITDWNSQALSAVDALGVQAPYAARDMATLHVAIYNAVEGITNGYDIYRSGTYTGPSGSAALGADIYAAATSAAYTVLQSLYPSLAGPGGALETQYNLHINALGNSQSVQDGVAWGQSVATDIITWRSTDGASGAQTPYTVSGLGHWQPTDPNVQQPVYPSWGSVTSFSIPSTSSVLPSTPAGYNSGDVSTTTLSAVLNGASNATLTGYLSTATYATDYNQVKDLGSLTSLTRTTDQTNAAFFWAAGAGTVTSTGIWNNIAESIATDVTYGFNYTLEENARLFAALNVALADAGIASWDAAYDVDFWRPVTAVAFESDPFNPDADSNPLTSGELGWTPLLNTPDFPEYASSSAALGSAAGTVLAAFFGDNVNFTADSDVFGDGTFIMSRSFSSFSEAADEAGMSQVYGGVTFNSSVTDGQTIGENVGDQVMANNFAPVPEPSGALLIAAAGLVIILRRRMGR